MNNAYYEFLRVEKSSDNEVGVVLRKHAGDWLWGLIKGSGVEVWESEEGCRSILRWGKEGIINGEGRIAQYNVEQMTRALNAIQRDWVFNSECEKTDG